MAVSTCDICGKSATRQAFVEGAKVSVCDNCASYGRVLEERKARPREVIVAKDVFVAQDYARIVSSGLSAKGLTVADAAKKFFINEGYLKQISLGERKPDTKVAAKLEKELGITLLAETLPEATKEKAVAKEKNFSNAITLGDIALIKRK